jgi:hypothetical protein
MPLDPQLDPHFDEAARLNNLDPLLLRALASGESGGNSSVTSSKGAGGLMQIMPETAQQYGIKDPYDPVQGVYGAARILNDHLTRAEQSKAAGANIVPVDEALRSYFAGPNGGNRGSQTAGYPGYIANRYRDLQGGSADATSTPSVSGIDALAAARGPLPPPGQVATNVRPPPGTPDTLDAAPPGVAALAALSGQGTAPTPMSVGAGGNRASVTPMPQPPPLPDNGLSAPLDVQGRPQQFAQAALSSDAELLRMTNELFPAAVKPNAQTNAPTGTGVPPGQTVNPQAVAESVARIDQNNILGRPSNPYDVEVAKRAPGLSGDPAYERALAAAKAGGEKQQQWNPITNQWELMPGAAQSAEDIKRAEATGHTLGTPATARQGETTGMYTKPGQQPTLTYNEAYQSPRLPEGVASQPPPPGSPPGTPPSAVVLPNAPEAIRIVTGAEAAGKGSVEPTTITIAGKEYPVTHEQFQQITKGLNIPGLATAAGTPGTTATGAPQQPDIGKTYLTPPESERAAELSKEYAGVVDNFTHAQASQGPLAAIQNASENYRTGPSAQTRLAFQKALQDAGQAIGVNSPEDAKQIASGEIIGKSGTQLGFTLSRTLGTREAQQLVQQAIATNPGLQNSPEGNRQLIGLINQGLQRDIDKRQFFDDWYNSHNHTYDGAGTAFNNTAPVDKYISNVLPFRPKNIDDYNQLKPGVRYFNPDNPQEIKRKPAS